MKEKYLSERYEPPEIDVQTVQVEVGFYGTYRPGGGGGSTTPADDPLYIFGGLEDLTHEDLQ